MATQITLPPNTRVAGQGNPPLDMDQVITALMAMQATSWVTPTNDATGAADAANVMAAYAALPTVGGTASGVIWMAPGIYYFAAGTVIINSPQVKIKGVLRWATKIFAVGSGDCIRMYNPTFGGGGFWGGGVEDVVIDGTHATAPATLLHIGDGEQYEVNVAVQNATGGGCWGVLWDNTVWWTEKLHGTIFARNCDSLIGFNVSGATTSTNSFGYLDLTCYVYVLSGQDGVVVQNGAYPYHGRLVIKGNVTGTSANALLRITGTVPAGHPSAGTGSGIARSRLDILAETGSSPGPYTVNFGAASVNFILGCGGILDFTQGTGAFTACNLPVQSNAGTFEYSGFVIGDTNLNPGGTFAAPAVIAPQVYAKGFLSTSNGNTFVDSADFFRITLTQSITISLTPAGAGTIPGPQRKTIIITQAAAGGPYTVTWPHTGSPSNTSPTVNWAGGTPPVMTATAGATDVYKVETFDGATWYGEALQAVS